MNCGNKKILFFGGALAVLLFAMFVRLGVEVADDAAFFLRYAENMTTGEFWVWNKGETPVWGASAPLYPLLIALPISLGVPAVPALVGTGMVVGAISLAFVGLLLATRFGYISGVAFVAFAALDTGMMYFIGSGLETPLTFALLSLGVWLLLDSPRAWVIGLVAGLLMVQKLDLVPIGVLLLTAYWIKIERLPLRTIIIAMVIACVWYGFAWMYFGSPVPNSFLTKAIYQNNFPRSIDWTWFGNFVFLVGIHKWLLGFSLIAVFARRANRPLVIYLGGMLLTHLVAYTIWHPFEPYNWYGMPSLFTMLILAAIGVLTTVEWLGKRFHQLQPFHLFSSSLLVCTVFVFSLRGEIEGTTNIKQFSGNHEFDRSQAGRWVRDNTPSNFRVYTMWGNPAYYSQRYVFDGSFLNRRYESVNIIQQYHPEILVLQNNPGSTPMNPVFAATNGEGYKIVKVFDQTFSKGMDYFFVVLARVDVIDKITNIELPIDLLHYTQKIQLGDKWGLLKVADHKTLFVHPGMTTPTRFEFDATAFGREGNKPYLVVEAVMAPNVPEEAVKRGAAIVKLTILETGQPIAEAVISVGSLFRKILSIKHNATYEFVVDNYNGSDTDWLWLSIK